MSWCLKASSETGDCTAHKRIAELEAEVERLRDIQESFKAEEELENELMQQSREEAQDEKMFHLKEQVCASMNRPHIPAEHAPEWATHYAMDEDFEWYWYGVELINKDGLWSEKSGSIEYDLCPTWDGDWRESLTRIEGR